MHRKAIDDKEPANETIVDVETSKELTNESEAPKEDPVDPDLSRI